MKKFGSKLAAVFLSAVMAFAFAHSEFIISLAVGEDSEVEKVPVYGFYNPNSGEHVFTIDEGEARNLSLAGWQEGDIKWYAPKTGVPVFRVYNPNVFGLGGVPLGDHHYTSDINEVTTLLRAGWKEGNVVFYSAKADDPNVTPIYGVYNPNAYTMRTSGAHHLTCNQAEANMLLRAGWKEGEPKFYGYAAVIYEEKFDILADGHYISDAYCLALFSDDMRVLTVTSSWARDDNNRRYNNAYPLRLYNIPVSKNCMVTATDGYYIIRQGPISEMADMVEHVAVDSNIPIYIGIENGEIVCINMNP